MSVVATYTPTGALLSDCGTYRYRLWREWGPVSSPLLGFVMLNPSTADAKDDDPTIRRCMGYARAWGYGGVRIANLCALRATNPKELLTHPDPCGGPLNEEALCWVAETCQRVVVAWGAFAGKLPAYFHLSPTHVMRNARRRHASFSEPLMCLRLTAAGFPAHPLYLPANIEPVPYRGPR